MNIVKSLQGNEMNLFFYRNRMRSCRQAPKEASKKLSAGLNCILERVSLHALQKRIAGTCHDPRTRQC